MGKARLGNQSEKRYNTGYFCGKSRKGGFTRFDGAFKLPKTSRTWFLETAGSVARSASKKPSRWSNFKESGRYGTNERTIDLPSLWQQQCDWLSDNWLGGALCVCRCACVLCVCRCFFMRMCVFECLCVCMFVCFFCSFVPFVRFVGVGRTVFMRQRNYKEKLIKEGKILKAKDRNEGYIYIHIYPEHLYRGLCLFYVSRAC